MSSSDSEDDCYGNAAAKLQNMINSYKGDKLKSTQLLDTTPETDKPVNNASDEPKPSSSSATDVPSPPTEVTSPSKDDPFNTSDDIELEKLLASNPPKNKRATRKTKKKQEIDTNSAPDMPLPPKRGRGGRATTANRDTTSRGRGRGRLSQGTIQAFLQNNTAPGRARTPRGRRRAPQVRFNALQALEALIPIFSVGNTDEYPDTSESQQLFSTKQNNEAADVVLIEEDPLDDNEELSVKVYWQSSEFFKFTVRRFQKLTQIFEYFSSKEGVSYDHLLFTFNNKILKPEDTPDSIDYNIGKFIDGGVVNKNVTHLVKNDSKDEENARNSIKIKFQCENLKKPIEMSVNLDATMSVPMLKCAEHIDKPVDKLRFLFDGEIVSAKSSPRKMDFEGGECIDVKILS